MEQPENVLKDVETIRKKNTQTGPVYPNFTRFSIRLKKLIDMSQYFREITATDAEKKKKPGERGGFRAFSVH